MRIMFDATFGPNFVMALRSIFALHASPKPLLEHLYERFPEGVKDPEWIPTLSGGDYLVITADLGRGGGPRLPRICSRHKITHVLFSPSMQRA